MGLKKLYDNLDESPETEIKLPSSDENVLKRKRCITGI
jgi:hypothetical protein